MVDIATNNELQSSFENSSRIAFRVNASQVAVILTAPESVEECEDMLLLYCRYLKSIPLNEEENPRDLFDEWFEEAEFVIGKSAKEDFWSQFQEFWKETEPLQMTADDIFDFAELHPLPEHDTAGQAVLGTVIFVLSQLFRPFPFHVDKGMVSERFDCCRDCVSDMIDEIAERGDISVIHDCSNCDSVLLAET